MRAREFLREEKNLPLEQADPMRYTYVLPGLTSSDPYQTYRFGVAIARARSDAVDDNTNPFRPAWSSDEVFGEHAVVAGMSPNLDKIIDQALQMTATPGGKQLIGTAKSHEPDSVENQSPVTGFKGYPR